MGSILGMVAPPINVPVMIIGSGIDMPYVGFDLPPLLILTIPPAILFSLWAAWGAKGQVEEGGLEAAQTAEEPLPGFKVYIPPLLVVLLLMIGSRGWGGKLDVGIPLMFVLGILAALVCGRPVALRQTVVSGIRLVLPPVLGILVGAGMFVQVMTVAGVRGGLIVTTALDMPEKKSLGCGCFGLTALWGGHFRLCFFICFGRAHRLGSFGGAQRNCYRGCPILNGGLGRPNPAHRYCAELGYAGGGSYRTAAPGNSEKVLLTGRLPFNLGFYRAL